MSGDLHRPVLLQPALDGLAIKKSGCYVDGTFGRGGHSRKILARLGPNGRLVSIDRDPEAIASATAEMRADSRLELLRGECAQLEELLAARNLVAEIDGILLDLGVSSPQLDDPRRGFSFRSDGPLDMRMDPDNGIPASCWLDSVDEKELSQVLRQFGEEPLARRYARAILAARPLTTTAQLANAIEAVAPARPSRRHPATRTFQAIRIAVNDELGQLRKALEASLNVLVKGGRLCVISFHSLEDRIVKRFMRDQSQEPRQYRGLPDIPEEFRPKLRRIGRPVAPDAEEVAVNRRARSARLRIAERC